MTDPARAEPLPIEVLRGSEVESLHLVDIAVSDAEGRLVRSWGDATRAVLPRSSLKPVQAHPLVAGGAADEFGLTDARLAIACGSHGGEPIHVDTVTAWLDDLAVGTDALECGAHAPMHAESAAALVRAGVEPDRRHNNCSGKHCGFLTLARHLGIEAAGYLDPAHPLQRDHLTPAIERWCGVSLAGQTPGIDGCGVPVWSIPLDRLAAAWAGLAGDLDGRRIYAAMTAEPMLVAGTGRACTRLMIGGGGRVAVKTGAEGVYCAVDLHSGSAVALKARDGATRASEAAIEWVLFTLGALPAPEPAPLHNWAGTLVGAVRVAD